MIRTLIIVFALLLSACAQVNQCQVSLPRPGIKVYRSAGEARCLEGFIQIGDDTDSDAIICTTITVVCPVPNPDRNDNTGLN